MPLTTTGRNNLLTDGLATKYSHVGLLTALTATESAGARVAVAWAAAALGVRDNTAQLTLPAGASETIVAAAIWDQLAAGGNQQAYFGIGSTVRGVGTAATTDLITSNGHGLTTDDRVFVYAVAGEALPTGLSASVLYYVLASGLTTDAFKLSATSGGAAVDITAVGELAFSKTVPEVFSASGGNVIIAAGALDVDATFA